MMLDKDLLENSVRFCGDCSQIPLRSLVANSVVASSMRSFSEEYLELKREIMIIIFLQQQKKHFPRKDKFFEIYNY